MVFSCLYTYWPVCFYAHILSIFIFCPFKANFNILIIIFKSVPTSSNVYIMFLMELYYCTHLLLVNGHYVMLLHMANMFSIFQHILLWEQHGYMVAVTFYHRVTPLLDQIHGKEASLAPNLGLSKVKIDFRFSPFTSSSFLLRPCPLAFLCNV